MSGFPPTSKDRLNSISRRQVPVPGANPAAASGKPLKFRPKVVARRTKEERDADAPTTVEGPAPDSRRPRGGLSARGATRGGRKRGGMPGTHVVSEGPLAGGFVTIKNNGPEFATFVKSESDGNAPDFLKQLRESRSRSATPGVEGEDDEEMADDGTALIDMNKEYEIDEAESLLFPVRAPRREHVDYEAAVKDPVKIEVAKEESPDTATDVESRTASVQPEEFRQIEDDIDEDLLNPVQFKEEETRLKEDSSELGKLFERQIKVKSEDGHEEKPEKAEFLFVQLPESLLQFKQATAPQRDTDNDVAVLEEEDEAEPQEVKKEETKDVADLSGKIGSLRIHQSGKVTMKIGDLVLDMTRGGASSFLQEMANVNHAQKQVNNLGFVKDKVIATPRLFP